jgi:hypothetical protein
MSGAADLIPRIEQARSGHQRAEELLSEAREMGSKPEELAPEPKEEERGLFGNLSLSDVGHTLLDGAGMIPGLGAFADGANALWYAAEGDWTNAGLSAMGAIPIAGDAATAARLVNRATDAARAVDNATDATRVADNTTDAARAAEPVKPSGAGGPESSNPSNPYGGTERGSASGRWYNSDESGGPTLPLSTERIQIKPGGIDAVERHVTRFGSNPQNEAQVQRLRDILDPTKPDVVATREDINFYAHELRESVRYRKEGFPSDGEIRLPDDDEAAASLWNNTHTATLEDYGHNERMDSFYHPDTK